jgi:hypothetical protein
MILYIARSSIKKLNASLGVKNLTPCVQVPTPFKNYLSFLKMPQCVAIMTNRSQCTRDGNHFENHCTLHFNKKMQKDEAFRARYEALQADTERLERAAAEERALRAAEELERRRAAAEARRAAELAARRAEKIAKKERYVAEVPNLGPIKIVDHAKKAMELWSSQSIPGYDIPKAYVALTYKPQTHAGYNALMTAVVRLRFQAFGNHPDHVNYGDVPAEERQTVLTSITEALAPYGEINLLRTLSDVDPMREVVLGRQRAEEEAARRAAAAAAEAARRAAFDAQLRNEPVVFARDPEGGINLRAFATDTQNIHRSSVQNSTHKAVVALLARPVLTGVDVLEEITAAFNDRARVRWYGPGPRGAETSRDAAVTELTNDYFNTEAFSVRYGDVVDRVWAFIRGHEHHQTLCTRLAQEVYEGRGMCSNGKMARLVNVLMGFDDTLEMEAPREVFQFRIAALRKAPLAGREAAARELFREFNIPETEQDAWLEPLLDPEEEAAPPAAAAV